MSRFIRVLTICFLAVAGAVGLGLVTSCNIIGGSSGGTGNLKLLMTDDPTEDWTELSVHFLSASLHRHGSDTWEPFWTATADPASGKVNLLDLNGITDILNSAPIKEGTYDRLKLVLNTSTQPESMTLIPAEGAQILPDNITVVDPSGTGEIKVDLVPNLVVEPDKNNIVGIDFDLAHPLSIVNLDGKVVISLKVRHKTLPRNLGSIQFARTLGDIKEAIANTDGTATFTITTLQPADIEFNANGNTIYLDVTSGTAVSSNFDAFKALAGTGAALVASNMNSDGSLYARRVWFADDINKLPQFTPEGLVRFVGDNWLSIQKKKTEALSTGSHHHRCDWNAETVFVDAATTWTFQNVDMGVTGTAGLKYVSRGFRVEVVFVNETDSPKVAQSINIQSAHAEGIVIDPTSDTLTLGWFWRSKIFHYSSLFSWWFYGTDSSASTVTADLGTAVTQARDAHLWVFAWAGLTWNKTDVRWDIENLVLAPMKLHDFTKITAGYNADTTQPETMVVSTFNCWDWTTPETMTIKLDHQATDAIETIVGSFIWKADTNVVTFTLPVPEGQWAALLTPTVDKVKIWVHPVKDGEIYNWHAYSVIAYQFIKSPTAVR